MDHKKRFRVIVVHRNGVETLSKCLTTLLSAVTDEDEIFVVDNGSEDESTALIRESFSTVTLIENGFNNGFAAANNQAITDNEAKYCLLLNNDAFVSESILARFAAIFDSDADIAVIAPQLITIDGAPQRSHGHFMKPVDEVLPKVFRRKPVLDLRHELVDVDSVIGACMAVRSSAIKRVGMLDDDFFFYFEETEWCHRFKQHGYRVVLATTVKVVHETGKSTRSLKNEAQIEMLRSRLLYYHKVFDKQTALSLEAYRYFRLLINFVMASVLLILTLGLHRKTRKSWGNYGNQLVWLLLGKPKHWGLPGKPKLN